MASATTYLQEARVVVNTTTKNEQVSEAKHNGYKPSCNMINMVPKQNTVGDKSPCELFTGDKVGLSQKCQDRVRRICTSSYERQCNKHDIRADFGAIKCRSWTHLPMPLKIVNMFSNRAARDGNAEMRLGVFQVK